MKIGILTFHCAHNYGAVLQCYALQEYLKNCGHNVSVIDYRPTYFTKTREYLKFSPRLFVTKQLSLLPKTFYEAVKFCNARINKWNAFENFIRTRLNLYQPVREFDGKDFEVCIVGSDQVWNSQITGGVFDKMFFGVNFKCDVISYAASTITSGYTIDEENTLKSLLSKFKAISVREQSLSDALTKLGIRDTSVVLDPTILAGSTPLKKLISKHKINKSYVAVYMVKQDPNLIEYANKYCTKHNLSLIEIANDFSNERYKTKIYTAGIEDFVTIINNAQFVITNSFHGTAVSILLQKQFVAIRQNGPIDNRIDQILIDFKLRNRFIQYDDSTTLDEIDYDIVNRNIEIYRQKSISFLTNALS